MSQAEAFKILAVPAWALGTSSFALPPSFGGRGHGLDTVQVLTGFLC